MNAARKLDLSDRFLNSKATKYYLRANMFDKAVATISLFTKQDTDPLLDLIEMQSSWFLVETADHYARLGESAKALEVYKEVLKYFDIVIDDQFDFHGYCLRKGTLRSYNDLIKFEDGIYSQPTFKHAILGFVEAYLYAIDVKDEMKELEEGVSQLSVSKKKKKQQPVTDDKQKEKKQFEGKDFLKGEDYLQEAFNVIRPAVEAEYQSDPAILSRGAELYIRKGTFHAFYALAYPVGHYLLAIRSLLKAFKVDKSHPLIPRTALYFWRNGN